MSYTSFLVRLLKAPTEPAGVAGDGWEVLVFGNNVTDEDYLEENITAPEFGGSFIHPGAESRWGLQLIVEL